MLKVAVPPVPRPDLEMVSARGHYRSASWLELNDLSDPSGIDAALVVHPLDEPELASRLSQGFRED